MLHFVETSIYYYVLKNDVSNSNSGQLRIRMKMHILSAIWYYNYLSLVLVMFYSYSFIIKKISKSKIAIRNGVNILWIKNYDQFNAVDLRFNLGLRSLLSVTEAIDDTVFVWLHGVIRYKYENKNRIRKL